MALNDTDVALRHRFPAYSGMLLAAFLRGATLDEAAAAAGVSRRTAARWKARHGGDLDEARARLLEGAQARLREALPATAEIVAQGARELGAAVPVALRRLVEILENRDADLMHVRLAAATVLDASARQSELAFSIHRRLAEQHELEERLSALEAALAQRAPAAAPRRPTLLAALPNP